MKTRQYDWDFPLIVFVDIDRIDHGNKKNQELNGSFDLTPTCTHMHTDGVLEMGQTTWVFNLPALHCVCVCVCVYVCACVCS